MPQLIAGVETGRQIRHYHQVNGDHSELTVGTVGPTVFMPGGKRGVLIDAPHGQTVLPADATVDVEGIDYQTEPVAPLYLWLLERVRGDVDYDEVAGFLIRAYSEDTARSIAAAAAKDEGSATWWGTEAVVKVERIGTALGSTDTGIVVADVKEA
jgi:hypothetical protein